MLSWLFGTVAGRKDKRDDDDKDDDKQSIKSTTSTVEETTNSEDSDTSCSTSSSDSKSVYQSRKRSGLAQRMYKSKRGKNKDACSHCRTCGNSCYTQQWDWDDDTDNWSTDYGSAGRGSYYTQGRGRSLRRPQQARGWDRGRCGWGRGRRGWGRGRGRRGWGRGRRGWGRKWGHPGYGY